MKARCNESGENELWSGQRGFQPSSADTPQTSGKERDVMERPCLPLPANGVEAPSAAPGSLERGSVASRPPSLCTKGKQVWGQEGSIATVTP